MSDISNVRIPTPSCVFWDFGDTLADERWMWPAPDGVPQWTEVYRQISTNGWADPWNRGDISSVDLSERLAQLLPMAATDVFAHLKVRCSQLQFFRHSFGAAKRCRLPQAIVTINPDLFREVIVPAYRLEAIFDVIVTSSEEHTLNKSDLCDVALQRLGLNLPRSAALLIDNKRQNIQGWQNRGGRGYWFVNDLKFEQDLKLELQNLACQLKGSGTESTAPWVDGEGGADEDL